MVTAAPVDPVDVLVHDKIPVLEPPSAPPATFVDPVDDDGNMKEVENVDCAGGITVATELPRLVESVGLVGGGIAGGVAWLTGGGITDAEVKLEGGGSTGGVETMTGGGITVEVVELAGGGNVVEGGVSAAGAVDVGSGAAADAVSMLARPHTANMSSLVNSLDAGAGALTVSPGTCITRVSGLSRDDDV